MRNPVRPIVPSVTINTSRDESYTTRLLPGWYLCQRQKHIIKLLISLRKILIPFEAFKTSWMIVSRVLGGLHLRKLQWLHENLIYLLQSLTMPELVALRASRLDSLFDCPGLDDHWSTVSVINTRLSVQDYLKLRKNLGHGQA